MLLASPSKPPSVKFAPFGFPTPALAWPLPVGSSIELSAPVAPELEPDPVLDFEPVVPLAGPDWVSSVEPKSKGTYFGPLLLPPLDDPV